MQNFNKKGKGSMRFVLVDFCIRLIFVKISERKVLKFDLSWYLNSSVSVTKVRHLPSRYHSETFFLTEDSILSLVSGRRINFQLFQKIQEGNYGWFISIFKHIKLPIYRFDFYPRETQSSFWQQKKIRLQNFFWSMHLYADSVINAKTAEVFGCLCYSKAYQTVTTGLNSKKGSSGCSPFVKDTFFVKLLCRNTYISKNPKCASDKGIYQFSKSKFAVNLGLVSSKLDSSKRFIFMRRSLEKYVKFCPRIAVLIVQTNKRLLLLMFYLVSQSQSFA